MPTVTTTAQKIMDSHKFLIHKLEDVNTQVAANKKKLVVMVDDYLAKLHKGYETRGMSSHEMQSLMKSAQSVGLKVSTPSLSKFKLTNERYTIYNNKIDGQYIVDSVLFAGKSSIFSEHPIDMLTFLEKRGSDSNYGEKLMLSKSEHYVQEKVKKLTQKELQVLLNGLDDFEKLFKHASNQAFVDYQHANKELLVLTENVDTVISKYKQLVR